MLERVGKRVHDVHVHEHGHHAGQHEQRGVIALDAQDEVAHGDDEPLHQAERHEQQPAPQVGLGDGEGRQALRIHPDAHDGHEDEAGHPEGQVGVEGRHARPVVAHRVDVDGLEADGRGHEAADVLGVEPQELGELVDGR